MFAAAVIRPIRIVHMPERGWIWPWFHKKIADRELSSRAIMMHKVTPAILPEVARTWQLRVPAPDDLQVDCTQSCAQWGWTYARTPCEPPPPLPAAEPGAWRGFRSPWNGSLCKIDPVEEGWECCFLRA